MRGTLVEKWLELAFPAASDKGLWRKVDLDARGGALYGCDPLVVREHPPVLIIPGMGASAAMYGPLAEELSARGISAYILDYRRHLAGDEDPRQQARLDDVLAEVRHAMWKLREIHGQASILAGHSLGGNLAFRAEAPGFSPHSIVAISPAPWRGGGLLRFILAGRASRRPGGLLALSLLLCGDFRPAQSVIDASLTGLPIEWHTAVKNMLRVESGGLVKDCVLAKLRRPRTCAPARIIGCEDDPVVPVGCAMSQFRRVEAELRLLPGLGHFSVLQDPSRIADAIIGDIPPPKRRVQIRLEDIGN